METKMAMNNENNRVNAGAYMMPEPYLSKLKKKSPGDKICFYFLIFFGLYLAVLFTIFLLQIK